MNIAFSFTIQIHKSRQADCLLLTSITPSQNTENFLHKPSNFLYHSNLYVTYSHWDVYLNVYSHYEKENHKHPFKPVFLFLLLAEKSPEIFPKHKIIFISESFALNWYIFVALTKKKLLLPLQCRLNKIFYLILKN